MPKGHHNHGHIPYAHLTEAQRLFPTLENTPDLRRGDTRLAAEVILAVVSRLKVPRDQAEAFEAARLKAFEILHHLAKG